MTGALEVVETWFSSSPVSPRVTRIEEPHVHEFLRANIWHIRGSARDVVIDAGLGIGSLRTECPQLFEREPILVVTHAHLDHMGSAHEFTERWAHPAEPVGRPVGDSLEGAKLAEQLGFDQELPELLITSRPAGFIPSDYRLAPAPATREILDGDLLDLGDLHFRVLHLPGHTPGSICLFEETSGVNRAPGPRPVVRWPTTAGAHRRLPRRMMSRSTIGSESPMSAVTVRCCPLQPVRRWWGSGGSGAGGGAGAGYPARPVRSPRHPLSARRR
jgi:hypothetical protein